MGENKNVFYYSFIKYPSHFKALRFRENMRKEKREEMNKCLKENLVS